MRWLLLIALTVLGTLAGEAFGLPSAALFAGMLAGIGVALTWPREETGLPPRLRRGAEAVIGVVLGTFVTLSTLEDIGSDLAPIFAVTVSTLALSVLGGLALARWTGLDRPTAAFGTIAGGATGVIVMARDLGADQRMVAVLQYLRVVVVVLVTPIVAAVAFGGTGGATRVAADGGLPGLAFTVLCVLAGLALVPRLRRVPAPTLLLPLGIAAALTVVGAPGVAPVPDILQQLAFGAIGLEVGLRFTPESLRQAGRLLLPALVLIAALLLASFGLALALAPWAGVSTLTAYLATTPGGLYAVLAIAVSSDADATFVLAVQVLRLLVMLIAAPLLARRLSGRGSASRSPGP